MSEELDTKNELVVAAPESKSLWQAVKPAFAAGVGLFSDGYVNNVIGSVTTCLSLQYGSTWSTSNAKHYVGDIAFAGAVVGQLFFGFLSDKYSRTNTLLISTIILIVFTALATGSYYQGDAVGMFNMLVAWRFFVGVGIGGEYPAGSVACAESTGELKAGTRNTWFIMFTNAAIDWGFVIGALVPYIVAAAAGSDRYETIWRTSLGIGVLFPLILFYLRLSMKEPKEYELNSMKNVQTPYLLALRFYGFRLFIISLIWFMYDFSSYSFGLFSSPILAAVYDDSAPLTTVFGWNTVINLFYIPGAMLGAPLSDKVGPRWALIIGVLAQAIVGFGMAGGYASLAQPSNVGAFAVIYGIFLSLGEVGPGNNIGLLAAKTSATGIRGRYYGIAAAIGKVGAFVGNFVFPYIVALGGDSDVLSAQYPFWVSGALCIVSAILAYFFVPNVTQDTIVEEDKRFREFLLENGVDVSQLGTQAADVEVSGSKEK
ncbi:hypothetical protein HDU83_008802 [Entophlyctis luteolus]|nr:hypothetical protein HDU82_002407 [Entophlyctis luteolus]KAJ3337381.1 hypothetical protein HDU83_008802 [Entophlyctis luteolus]